MDPKTVVLVLAAHMLCSGALFALIGRRMPPRQGVQAWAAALSLFGTAYALRTLLPTPDPNHPLPGLLPDVAMIASAVLFARGLQQFAGGRAPALAPAAAVLVAFTVLEVVAIWRHGALGRHVAVNLGLGCAYGWLAFNA